MSKFFKKILNNGDEYYYSVPDQYYYFRGITVVIDRSRLNELCKIENGSVIGDEDGLIPITPDEFDDAFQLAWRVIMTQHEQIMSPIFNSGL